MLKLGWVWCSLQPLSICCELALCRRVQACQFWLVAGIVAKGWEHEVRLSSLTEFRQIQWRSLDPSVRGVANVQGGSCWLAFWLDRLIIFTL